ncbi:MAG: hypothetical protein VKL59_06490 [Nostocaceae cyanobacterium]|nr:hypothetical protein [Nostocaceae cyanobacterium]
MNNKIFQPSYQKQSSQSDGILELELLSPPMTSSWQGQNMNQSGVNSPVTLDYNARSLMPMKERDFIAMAALFDIEDGEAMEEEIKSKLLWLGPEPCWEDDPL